MRTNRLLSTRLMNRYPRLGLSAVAIALLPLAFAHAAVDQPTQQNAICYVKESAPQLITGTLPFSCTRKPAAFVEQVRSEVRTLSGTTLVPNLADCRDKLYEAANMLHIARGVWDLRDSPVLSTNAAIASSIADVCRSTSGTGARTQNNGASPADQASTFPMRVQKTFAYKPFTILAKASGRQMSDVEAATKYLCKSPSDTVAETMDLLQNYELIDTSKTDGTMTVTTFRGRQLGKPVSVSLAVDEQSKPRIVQYLLVDGQPALACK